MATITVSINSDVFGEIFDVMVDRLSDPKPALETIGVEMVSRTQRGFYEGGRENKKWPPTMMPNVPAIAKRLSEGKNMKSTYWQGGKKPLLDSGQLRQSITHKVVNDIVEVGTSLPYAVDHQFGLEVSIENKIPDLLKAKNKKVLREISKLRKKFRGAAKFLSKKKDISVKIRERKFLLVTRDDADMIVEVFQNYFMRGK